MIKVKIYYNGEDKNSINEVLLPCIPSVGDNINIRFSDLQGKYTSHTIESIDWWITDGLFDFIEIYLTDEQ